MRKKMASGLLLIALAVAFPSAAAPGFCDDQERGVMADRRAAWENHLFNRDSRGRTIFPAFDQAAALMQAHHWRTALRLLEGIERHPTRDARLAGLDEAAAGLALLIRHCSRGWLTPNDPDSDDYPAINYHGHISAYSIWPKVIFINVNGGKGRGRPHG